MAFDRILQPTSSDGIGAIRARGGGGTVPA
jgi:hypothetical protein